MVYDENSLIITKKTHQNDDIVMMLQGLGGKRYPKGWWKIKFTIIKHWEKHCSHKFGPDDALF